jgi:fatty-acyl-CoA synthase
MRDDSYINITGRAKDVILRGGENVYAREVEEFLLTHPKIMEVYVVGLPDVRLGEVVLAWVRLREGSEASEEEIRDFCNGRIAHFKAPQYVRFVDSFPMTVTGKIQKFLIRKQEIEARGLQEAARVETA